MKHAIALSFITLLAGLGLGALLFSGGSPGDDGPGSAAGASTWTCSMHPQIQQPNPGKCPICAMDLIPLSNANAQVGPRQFAMSPEAKALANITTTKVQRTHPEAEVHLFGRVVHDETRVRSIAARFPSRIDRLFVDFTGVRVSKGDELAVVYSPELLSAQTELLSAIRFGNQDGIAGARDKLRLWGFHDSRISAIEASGQTSDRLTIDAPASGIVTQKHINEGDYVKTGSPLFQITDHSQVWLMLDAYESDLPWIRYGQKLTFDVEGIPGQEFSGTIIFIDHQLDPKTRTVRLRVNVPNPDLTLKPGMFATAVVKAHIAGHGLVVDPSLAGKWISPMHPEIVKDAPGKCDLCGMSLVKAEDLGYTVIADDSDAPLVIPASAVLHTGKRSVVYVQVPDKDTPTYEGLEIELGPRAGHHYIVTDGLTEGQKVVTGGAFKIDSALQIEAKPSMMNLPPEIEPRTDISIGDYLAAQKALAADDFAATKTILPFAETPDITAARSLFHQFSIGLIAAIQASELQHEAPLSLTHCPMAFDWLGADWLQLEGEIRNPYFGAEMLTCGHAKQTFKPGETTPAIHNH